MAYFIPPSSEFSCLYTDAFPLRGKRYCLIFKWAHFGYTHTNSIYYSISISVCQQNIPYEKKFYLFHNLSVFCCCMRGNKSQNRGGFYMYFSPTSGRKVPKEAPHKGKPTVFPYVSFSLDDARTRRSRVDCAPYEPIAVEPSCCQAWQPTRSRRAGVGWVGVL